MSPQSSGRGTGPERRAPQRRPEPQRPSRAVYWRRRAVVFGTPLAVVIAVVALFSGGHGSSPQQATLAGKATVPTPTAATAAANPSQTVNAAASACPPSSIQVTPSVTGGVAGGPIQINLAIATTQPACSFAMSGSNVAVRINSGTNALWTSQNCPSVVPSGTLSLRSGAPTDVSVSWDGHQSSGSCGATNPWVGPGTYQLIASVIGSTPTTGNFTLTLPNAPTVTQTATPTPTPSASASASPTH